MNITITKPGLNDLDEIIQVEKICFPIKEAASSNELKQRYYTFPECFLIAKDQNEIIGYIAGCITDSLILDDELYHNASLHNKNGKYQTVFSLAVLPDYQHHKIARQLLNQFIKLSQEKGHYGMILTCKDYLIDYYESFGFIKQQVSASTHGESKWNDMLFLYNLEEKDETDI